MINPTASAAASATANVARLIYTAVKEGVPTAFLQWNQGGRGRGTQIALLHLVSRYAQRMELMVSLWDDLYFALTGDVTCDAITCVNWHTTSLHHIGSTVHVLTDLAIDLELTVDVDADLMGPFTAAKEECWENTDGIQKGAPPSSAPKNGAPPFQCSPESDLDFHVELYELHIMVCLGRP